MKYIRLSTTSKIYLLTLLLPAGFLFLNHTVYGQSPSPQTISEQRLEIMGRYLSWVESGEYGKFSNSLGQKALGEFKSYLSRVIPEDNLCLKTATQEPSVLDKIKNFFQQFFPGYRAPETTAQKLSGCKGKIKIDYKQAKKYNRLLKYLQIEEGKPNLCVKADLGVGTALKARGFNPTKVDPKDPEQQGLTPSFPVYLCTGQDGGKKVRIVDDSGTRLRLSPQDSTRSALMVENLPPKESLNKLMERLGL